MMLAIYKLISVLVLVSISCFAFAAQDVEDECPAFSKMEHDLETLDDKYLALFLNCRAHYFGGNLEDLYRLAGQYIYHNSDAFIEQIGKSGLNDNEFRNMLLMLPLSSVDNIEAKKEDLQKRIKALSNLQNNSNEARDKAINILTQKYQFFESIKDESNTLKPE